jgi:hypothetical protein
MMLIHVVDHLVHVVVILSSIHVSKVISKKNKTFIGNVMCTSIVKIGQENLCFTWCVVCVGRFIVNPRLVIVKNIEVETSRGAVVLEQSMGK